MQLARQCPRIKCWGKLEHLNVTHFDLCLVELQRGGDFDATGAGKVFVEVELLLQLGQLLGGEVGASSVVGVVGTGEAVAVAVAIAAAEATGAGHVRRSRAGGGQRAQRAIRIGRATVVAILGTGRWVGFGDKQTNKQTKVNVNYANNLGRGKQTGAC